MDFLQLGKKSSIPVKLDFLERHTHTHCNSCSSELNGLKVSVALLILAYTEMHLVGV